MSGMEEIRTPKAEDETIEGAVLRQLLDLHPVQLTLAEVVREMSPEKADFSQRDAVARAVKQLAAAGLVHHSGELVLPTRAALRFYELLD